MHPLAVGEMPLLLLGFYKQCALYAYFYIQFSICVLLFGRFVSFSRKSVSIHFFPCCYLYPIFFWSHSHFKDWFWFRRLPSEAMKKIGKIIFNTLDCIPRYLCSKTGDAVAVFKCIYASIHCVQRPLDYCLPLHIIFNQQRVKPFTMFLFMLWQLK